jgi:hypothetical protein
MRRKNRKNRMPSTWTDSALTALAFVLSTSAMNAKEILPRPEPPFKEKIGPTAKESTPDFPQEFKRPRDRRRSY